MYYHGESIAVNVHVQNNSNKTVKRIKVAVVQVADICLFTTASYTCEVAKVESTFVSISLLARCLLPIEPVGIAKMFSSILYCAIRYSRKTCGLHHFWMCSAEYVFVQLCHKLVANTLQN